MARPTQQHPAPPPPDMPEAALRAIAEDVLERATRSLFTCDFDEWANATTLPVTLVSREGTSIPRTSAEKRTHFDLFCAAMQTQQVTDIIRQVMTAERIDPWHIAASYKTEMLRHADRVVDPYHSTMTLLFCGDGQWRASTVLNALGHVNWTATDQRGDRP